MRLTALSAIVLLILVGDSRAIFGDRFQKIKNKAKQFYKSKFGKDKTWHFLGHDVTEYPGANPKYREINVKKWQDYYDCLKFQEERLGPHKSVTPEAVQGFEGGFVKFECKLCVSPKEKSNANSIEWDFASLDDKELQPVEYTENIFASPEDKTLHVYNLKEQHTGQYKCRLGRALTAPYFLTVANLSEQLDEVHSDRAPKGPYPKFPTNVPEFNLIIDTEWGPWSSCSKCGKVGRKHRLGYCFIILRETTEEIAPNENSTLMNATISNAAQGSVAYSKNHKKHAVTEVDLELLRIFKYGIPCRSHILPDSIKNLEAVKSRRGELMTGFCKEDCPEAKVFEVKDKDGKLIETANNSAGIYSMLQGLPPIEPPVERRLQYERKGTNIILACPGNLNSDTPIHWQIGSKNLVPDLIFQETSGRIFVSLMEKIHINKAKLHDSNVYSCWQNNELAGTVRLVVEKRLKLNFNHHLMLIGLVVVLSTFLYIFVKAFFGRKYARTY